MRLDVKLAQMFPAISRNKCQKLISEGVVSVNGCPTTDKDRKLKISDSDKIILLDENVAKASNNEVKLPAPFDLNLDIIYEDEYLMVVNKPRGLVVHPGAGTSEPTLVSGLLHHCGDKLSDIGGHDRPGIVHRIDKDTTGVLVVCKNDMAHKSLAEQLKEHSITRKYEAIVYNNFTQEEGTVDAPIGRSPVDRKKMAVEPKNGKRAVTHYKVLSHLNHQVNHIECQLETGRTHQIRVHMASIRHPLLGDTIYGPKNDMGLTGQCLHARVLGFVHPRTGEYVEFEAPLPEYFQKLLEKYS